MLETNLAVPMRDGTILRADLRRAAGPGPFPVLILRTPYGKGADKDELRFAASAVARGYAVLMQDVRGRFESGGDFVPHVNEGRDGYDTIEWAARQPWCDGRVGTFGLSYAGSAQWFAALEAPPHLVAMAPAMTFASLRRAVYPGGAFDMDWLRWTLLPMAPDTRARKGLPGHRTAREAVAHWLGLGPERMQGHLPLLSQPELDPATAFYADWLRHPPHDPYWDYAEFAGRHHLVRAAVLNLSGWHDDSFSVAGAIANHLGLLKARTGQADPLSMLVLGPWSHGINAITGDVRYSTRDFGPLADFDYDGLVLDFMDRHVRGMAERLAGAPAVRFFVMGENRWREVSAWPPDSAPLALHLGPPKRPDGPGTLDAASPGQAQAPGAFTADPASPVRMVPDSDLGAVDMRALGPGPDRLVYETAPLERDLAVAGTIRAEIFIEADVPDLDLHLRLLDVAPDGTAYNLMDSRAEVLRASLRPEGNDTGGLAGAKRLLEPGRTYRLVLERMTTANTFKAGHRIRAVACTSWFPSISRNLQTGENEAVSAVTRTARVTIRHDAKHPSRIILPVLP